LVSPLLIKQAGDLFQAPRYLCVDCSSHKLVWSKRHAIRFWDELNPWRFLLIKFNQSYDALPLDAPA